MTTLEHDPHWRRKLAINAGGAAMTAVVTVEFAVAKFVEGAWIVVLLVPALVFVFFRIHRHYLGVRRQLALGGEDLGRYLATPTRRLRLLVVGNFERHTLPALREMLQTDGHTVMQLAVHVDEHEQATQELRRRWREWRLDELGLPLVVLPSEFGAVDVVGELVEYVHGALAADPQLEVDVVIPEYSTSGPWWSRVLTPALHHMRGARLKLAFLVEDRVTVTNHRYLLGHAAEPGAAAHTGK